ncbi:hypothetical protein L2734_17705 [Parashewanella spongiae]|uniref:hypothetical protein n=1 Tax=Parashewanella spongiae TaxID=342950 RepID=UPI0015D465A9|nr:hypothetical protein [Parashewanella spongiae]MCL1079970.1 hypothetical protein [Parashewanella spongiae]
MKSLSLPSLTSNFLQRSGTQIDNSFSTSWKQLGFVSMLTSCGFSKRSGIEATEAVYLLMLWVWLKVDTISMFAKGRCGRQYTDESSSLQRRLESSAFKLFYKSHWIPAFAGMTKKI